MIRIEFERWPWQRCDTVYTEAMKRSPDAPKRFGWGLVRGYGSETFINEFGRFGGGTDYALSVEYSQSRKSIILYLIFGMIYITWKD